MAVAGEKPYIHPNFPICIVVGLGPIVHVFDKDKPKIKRDTWQNKGCGEAQPATTNLEQNLEHIACFGDEDMEAEQKAFLLRVDVMANNIQTSMKTQNVTPQEAIGFLGDMRKLAFARLCQAKDQILDNLKQERKDIFQAFKKEGDSK